MHVAHPRRDPGPRQTDILDHNPNIVLIWGWRERRRLEPSRDSRPRLGLLYDMLAAALPNTDFIVARPTRPRDPASWMPNQISMRDAIQAQVEARSWYVVHPVTEDGSPAPAT
ncbi:hypothetical protein GCM10009609_40190 [Pseudonocardia aurantiaca]